MHRIKLIRIFVVLGLALGLTFGSAIAAPTVAKNFAKELSAAQTLANQVDGLIQTRMVVKSAPKAGFQHKYAKVANTGIDQAITGLQTTVTSKLNYLVAQLDSGVMSTKKFSKRTKRIMGIALRARVQFEDIGFTKELRAKLAIKTAKQFKAMKAQYALGKKPATTVATATKKAPAKKFATKTPTQNTKVTQPQKGQSD